MPRIVSYTPSHRQIIAAIKMNISPQNSTIPEQIVYCHYPMPSPKRKAVRSNRTGDAKQEPPPPNRIADLLSHGKRPLRLTRPRGAFPEKREVRKNHFRFRRSEASLHLHGYYNAFSQNCKFYFVKSILSMSNLRAVICLYCMFVNILCFLLLFP